MARIFGEKGGEVLYYFFVSLLHWYQKKIVSFFTPPPPPPPLLLVFGEMSNPSIIPNPPIIRYSRVYSDQI